MLHLEQKPMETTTQLWKRIIKEVYNNGRYYIDERDNNVIKVHNLLVEFDSEFNYDNYIENPTWEEKFYEELLSPSQGDFHYTYGNRIHENKQLKAVIDRLRNRVYTRRAVIDIFRSTDASSSKEIPCVTQLHFNCEFNKLHLNCFMRSNDIVGALPADVYGFLQLQNYVANSIGFRTGKYTHWVTDAHIILDHYEDKLRSLGITRE